MENEIGNRIKPMSDKMVLKNIQNLKRKRQTQRVTKQVSKIKIDKK